MLLPADGMLRLALGDGIAGLAEAQRQLAAFLEASGCPPRIVFRAELVVEEGVMNVLTHGQPAAAPARMWLEARRTADRVLLALEDDGPAFDPTQVVSPVRSRGLEDAAEGGMGLLLIRRMAEAVRYARTMTRNRLEMELAL